MAPPMSKPTRPVRTPDEAAVWRIFTDQIRAGYQALGCCQNPTCESKGSLVVIAGRAPSARICVTCFEYDFDCVHPTPAALERRRAH
jgi:hypothetical protein